MADKMSKSSSFEEELLSDFVEVADEHIQAVEDNLFQLESDPENIELINEIFRSVHSMKGDAGSLGIKNIKELSHSMENIFDSVRDKKIFVTENLLDLMFDATRALRDMLSSVMKGNYNETDSDILKRLQSFQNGALLLPEDNKECDDNRVILEKDNNDNNDNKEKITEEAEDSDHDVENRYVLFKLNNMIFAVEIKKVQEVVDDIPSTKVPLKEDYIEGLINLRGTIVPVIRLFKRFKLKEGEDKGAKILIVFHNREKIGLRIDEVISVVDIDEDSITVNGSGILDFKEGSFIKGILKRDNDIILFLRLERVLDRNIY